MLILFQLVCRLGWRGYGLPWRSGSWHLDTVFLCKLERKPKRWSVQCNQHSDLRKPQSHVRGTFSTSYSNACYLFKSSVPRPQCCSYKFQETIRGKISLNIWHWVETVLNIWQNIGEVFVMKLTDITLLREFIRLYHISGLIFFYPNQSCLLPSVKHCLTIT